MTIDLSSKWLAAHGVKASQKDLAELSQLAMAELESRVGAIIAGQLSDEQIAEFEHLLETSDDDTRQDWLGKAMPDYKDIVHDEYAKMTAEIEGHTDKPGLIRGWDADSD